MPLNIYIFVWRLKNRDLQCSSAFFPHFFPFRLAETLANSQGGESSAAAALSHRCKRGAKESQFAPKLFSSTSHYIPAGYNHPVQFYILGIELLNPINWSRSLCLSLLLVFFIYNITR